jgi:hypothetical protein
MKTLSLFSLRSMICLFLIAASLLVFLMFVAAQIRLMNIDVMRDYGEGHTMWMSQKINDLSRAYKPLDDLPYIIFPYPPLYLITSKMVSAGVGNLLLAGRTVSLLSTITLAFILGRLVYGSIPGAFPRLWRLSSASMAAALVFSTESVIGWASLMRVDMLGLALMYGGLAVYSVAGKRESWQYLAVFLFVLAAFTKQTLLSAPVACAIFGLFAYPKATIRVYSFALVLGMLGLFICNWLTEGGFLKNIVSYNLNPFSWDVVFSQFSAHFGLKNIALKAILSLAAFITLWRGKGPRLFGWKRFIHITSGKSFPRIIILGSINAGIAFVLSVSIGKMGSYYNFFLALDIALCLLSVLYLFRLFATWRLNLQTVPIAPLATAAISILLFLPSRRAIAMVSENFDDQVREEARLINLIQKTPGPVLSDNMYIISKAGREAEVEPATLSFLTLAGGWDETPYLNLFNKHYFSLIISTPLKSSSDRYSPAAISAIGKNYEISGQIGEYLIYRRLPFVDNRDKKQQVLKSSL